MAALVRKLLFLSTHRIVLADRVRNFTYQWAWRHIRSRTAVGRVCDIGSRNSLFPAFLAWRGYCVTASDVDPCVVAMQKRNGERWHANIDIVQKSATDLPATDQFDVVTALYALQHAGESDSEACRHSARITKPGGMLLAVNEYDPRETQWHRGRIDGDMRIYGPQDIQQRITVPLAEVGILVEEQRYARADFPAQKIHWAAGPGDGNVCFLMGIKQA